MVTLDEIQAAYYMVAATGVLVAAVFYVLNMRAQNRNRVAQLFMNIANQSFNNPEWLRAYKAFTRTNWRSAKEFMEVYDWPNENEFGNATLHAGGVFESLGVLVKENLLDIRMVALLMSSYVKGYYGKLDPYIEELRANLGSARYWSETEYLYKRLIEYMDQHPELKT
jgi:hypothetical protein